MRAVPAERLLAMPVRLRGIQLGHPVDLLVDRAELNVVGFDVLCGDAVHRFLPFPTATITADEIGVHSPLVFLEEDELAFYRARTFGLAALRGTPVKLRGRIVGFLEDIIVGSPGVLVEVVLGVNGTRRRLPFDDTVRFQPQSRYAA